MAITVKPAAIAIRGVLRVMWVSLSLGSSTIDGEGVAEWC
jgi:hypothetical protein